MQLPDLPLTPRVILVAPLNWGLGHAARSAAIIEALKVKYPVAHIIIASDGAALAWLRTRFDGMTTDTLPGYHIRYPRGKWLILRMALSAPRLLLGIIREHRAVGKLVRRYKVDVVISDNRFGCRNSGAYSVFVTHQLILASPGRGYGLVMKTANALNRFFIRKFRQCWVPDFPDSPGLAGALSHPPDPPPNVSYIGPLSRFGSATPAPASGEPCGLLCLVSGPEPQRTIFLGMLIRQLTAGAIPAVIVAGDPGGEVPPNLPPHILYHPDLPDPELHRLIRCSPLIISRSGYSTIMDLYHTGGKAAFVPTPGQTEQEYLATMLMDNGIAFMMDQQECSVKEMISRSVHYSGFPAPGR